MATRRAMPVLQVRDVAASTAFYERLGFYSHGFWGNPPAFCIVQRGDVTIALDGGKDDPPVNQWWAAYIYVDDAKALREEFIAEGLQPDEMRAPTDYGCIDFDMVDRDGHRLAFGQSLRPDPAPGLDHQRGRG